MCIRDSSLVGLGLCAVCGVPCAVLPAHHGAAGVTGYRRRRGVGYRRGPDERGSSQASEAVHTLKGGEEVKGSLSVAPTEHEKELVDGSLAATKVDK
eukprot:832826-Rhodomonas_salina.2